MIHIEKEKKHLPGFILPIFSFVIFLLILSVTLFGVQTISRKTEAEQLNMLEQAVLRANIQCYAIEGRYPPNVEYLEEHYGLSIDRDRYHVFYDGWASNIMPDITILPVQQTKEGFSWQ